MNHKCNDGASLKYPALTHEEESSHLGYVKLSYYEGGDFSIEAIIIHEQSGEYKSIMLKQ